MRVAIFFVAAMTTAWLPCPVISEQQALFVKQVRNGKRVARQTSADQMVQNILQWLQSVYTQNSRRIRQGSVRDYALPMNTEKPRPFESPAGHDETDNFIGYPGPGSSPEPSFPFPGGVAGNGYLPPRPFPTITPSTGYPGGPSTGYPEHTTGYPGPSTHTPGDGYHPSITPTYGPPSPTTKPTYGTQPPTYGTSPPPTYGTTKPTYGTPPPTYGTTKPTYGTPPPTYGTTKPTYGTSPPTSATLPSKPTYGTQPPTYVPSTDGPDEPDHPAPGEFVSTDAPDTPDNNVIPGDNDSNESETAEDLKHPPHIHAIEVECAKDMMTINIEFNRVFNGIIYSKGFYKNPECRYVMENSGQTKYTFTVSLNSCGTEFINAFDTEGQSYLENILVLQNEEGIQEVWDTIRAVRCLWEGNLNKALSVALSVGMLQQEIVTFSGDTAMAMLDIQLGKGPFAQPANGLVKIGDTMTLVVSVTGDPGFDLQVKDCRARDSTGDKEVALTDDDGCVLKPKLFGAFQKTRNTGNSGASIMAYAYFNAFKFPDVMDLMIECNVELCKTDCEMCSKPGQNTEPGRRRRKRSADDELAEPVKMGKMLKVILPEDLSVGEAIINLNQRDEICISTHSFVLSSSLLITLLTISTFFTTYLWLKNQRLTLLQLKH